MRIGAGAGVGALIGVPRLAAKITGMANASADRGIEHRAVWAALERLELYGLRDEALRALAAEHRDDDPTVAAAARYVIGLRRVLAAGGAC